MSIDWAALGIVSVVSVVASVSFVILLSYGVRFVSTAKLSSHQGERSGGTLSLGYAFLGCAALLVLYCIYLIVPQFH